MKLASLIITTVIALLFAGAGALYWRAANGAPGDEAIAAAFVAANVAAEEGDLQTAITSYEELIEGGRQSAALHYNLANAQQRAGDLGAAILHYERAAALDPGASDIATNLARARKEAASIEGGPSAWSAFAARLSINQWAAAGAVSLLVPTLVLAGSAFGFVSLPRWIPAVGLTAVFACVGLSVAAVKTLARDARETAIVLQPGTPLRVSPFEDAKARATLPAGRKLRILSDPEHQGYQLAQLSSGEQGWLLPGKEFATLSQR